MAIILAAGNKWALCQSEWYRGSEAFVSCLMRRGLFFYLPAFLLASVYRFLFTEEQPFHSSI